MSDFSVSLRAVYIVFSSEKRKRGKTRTACRQGGVIRSKAFRRYSALFSEQGNLADKQLEFSPFFSSHYTNMLLYFVSLCQSCFQCITQGLLLTATFHFSFVSHLSCFFLLFQTWLRCRLSMGQSGTPAVSSSTAPAATVTATAIPKRPKPRKKWRMWKKRWRRTKR